MAMNFFQLGMSIFWGIIVTFYILYKFLRHPVKSWRTVRRGAPPVDLQDSVFGVHRHAFLPERGLTLHYVEKGPADADVLLFVHGFPEFWYSWRHQILEFSRQFRVVAVDMRGYGDSDKPEGIAAYAVDHLVEDIRSLILHLGAKKTHLISHDWGGAVAWNLTSRYPHLVDRFIVCNCPIPGVAAKFIRENLGQLWMSWYMFFFQIPFLPEILFHLCDYEIFEMGFWQYPSMGFKQPEAFTSKDMETWKYVFAKHGLTGPINYYRAAMRVPKIKFEPFSNKSLIIWGSEDGFLHKELAQRSATKIPNATLKFVDGASHWVQQDNPTEVNRIIWEFLEN